MKDGEEEEKGFINIKGGTISLFNIGFQDCDKVQSWNPILSSDRRKELCNLFLNNFAEFEQDTDKWQCPKQDWKCNSVEFMLLNTFTVREHKVQWDGDSPFPEHAKEDVEMPMFNIFDGGHNDGLITIAEHKGAIVIKGTLWEKSGSINIWVKF